MSSYNELDLEYIALRFVGGLSSRDVKNLIASQIIKNHRDINFDFIQSNLHTFSGKLQMKIKSLNSMIFELRDAIETYKKLIDKCDIKVVSVLDDIYPQSWKDLSGMPDVFFARGNLDILKACSSKGSVGVVGSRTPCQYSLYATEQFVKELVDKEVVVVSGGAIGIDRKAHFTALRNNGKTIIVSPCGLDLIYPFNNRDLFNACYEYGLVISEMPPGQKAMKQYFPARNRLIAGLSDVCLIMEAGEYSGTLHTASFAASYGKDVFVLPNNIYVENAVGGLKLIQDGAEILLDSKEVINRIAGYVLERLQGSYLDNANNLDVISDIKTRIKTDSSNVSDDELKLLICDELSVRPKSIDDLSVTISIPFSYLSILVSELEMEGKLETKAGKYFLTIKRS